MNSTLSSRRRYRVFLSHSSKDKRFARELEEWLREEAGLSVWFDARTLKTSERLASALPDAVAECQALILVVSKHSVQSHYVEEEFNLAVNQQRERPDFRIIPLVLGPLKLPAVLQTRSFIHLDGPKLTGQAAFQLLRELYPETVKPAPETAKNVYVSRGWQPQDAPLAEAVCQSLNKNGFRLIGDAEDHPDNDPEQASRIRRIVANCGAFACIAPARDTKCTTSSYVLDEIRLARSLGLPRLIVAPRVVSWPKDLAHESVIAADHPGHLSRGQLTTKFRSAIVDLLEHYQSKHRDYVFYETDRSNGAAYEIDDVRRLISGVTALGSRVRADIHEAPLTANIVSRIRNAFMTIADVWHGSSDLWLAAGSALNNETQLRVIMRGTKPARPVLLGDTYVGTYKDDLNRLALLHRILFPHRRRIMNFELPRPSWGGAS